MGRWPVARIANLRDLEHYQFRAALGAASKSRPRIPISCVGKPLILRRARHPRHGLWLPASAVIEIDLRSCSLGRRGFVYAAEQLLLPTGTGVLGDLLRQIMETAPTSLKKHDGSGHDHRDSETQLRCFKSRVCRRFESLASLPTKRDIRGWPSGYSIHD